jgi:hypothetical protein
MTGSGRGARGGDAAVVAALQGALAAENAAIFGYGVAGAYLTGARQATATAYWNDHRSARDALAALLRARGRQPGAAADAYQLPFGVRTGAEAVSLATFIENGVAAAYLALVGTSDPGLRALGARAMQDAAVRAAFWQGSTEAFPGMPEAALTSPPSHPAGLCRGPGCGGRVTPAARARARGQLQHALRNCRRKSADAPD